MLKLFTTLFVGSVVALTRFSHESEFNPAIHGSNWIMGERACPKHMIKLVVAVAQSNVDKAEALLLEISDPTSESYTNYFSIEDVHEILAPSKDNVIAVLKWLKDGNVDRVITLETVNADFISVVVSVEEAEALLNSQYHYYTHSESGKKVVLLSTGYSVPTHLISAIDFISPTTRFPQVKSSIVIEQANTLAGPTPFNTPEILAGLYKTTGVEHDKVKAKKNKIGFCNFIGQHWSTTELELFWKTYNIEGGAGSEIINRPANQTQGEGVEALLDSQYITASGRGIPTVSYSNDDPQPDDPENEAFLEWIIDVSNDKDAPFVYSVSYGEDERLVNFQYAQRCNVEFMKAGLRGISILMSSGDSGAGGNCTAGSGLAVANFPVSSPWVTGVGGTLYGTPGATPTGEIVDPISGGGFSNYFPKAPKFQKKAIKHYLKNCEENKCPEFDTFNYKGRGYPDIAAQSHGYQVFVNGAPISVGGTSASCPTSAGIIGLINDKRIAAGKKQLGFLNPFLYYAARVDKLAFNDVLLGTNQGCNEGGLGFTAGEGWDPVSGLGTPNYEKLVEIALKLR